MTRRPSHDSERGRLAPAWVSWTVVAILVVLALIAFLPLVMLPVLLFWYLLLGLPVALILFGIPSLVVWRMHRRDLANRD